MAMSCDEREYWDGVAHEFRNEGPPCPGDDCEPCDELDDEPVLAAHEPDRALGFRWVR